VVRKNSNAGAVIDTRYEAFVVSARATAAKIFWAQSRRDSLIRKHAMGTRAARDTTKSRRKRRRFQRSRERR
jgi:hypothetical protein